MKLVAKNRVEIEKMRAAGRLGAEVLDFITPHVKPGVSTLQLNDLCHEFIIKNKAIPAPLNYRGFPKSICTSVNDVVCHGIPNADEILKDGDIINIDVTVILEGFHGDTSRMFYVGNVSAENKKLVETTYHCMMAGIETIKSGSWLNEIGNSIEALATPAGFSVVREFVGHGIGTEFHTEPTVLHYAHTEKAFNARLKKGVTFTVEPMINAGKWQTWIDEKDNWTARTIDGKNSAQFEHTVLVTEDGVEILTASPAGHTLPPYK